ncbi:hypothetical protein ElyMa_001555300 [Elysia marginata]|uniref:Uncharacterized protein n=1 Tax=Elysia marginata TaxID=1093978 RepID=A0AAV4JEJ2_9GAST|nr:hypothetical protein ElyMa_001555300 [Elysia marginata]
MYLSSLSKVLNIDLPKQDSNPRLLDLKAECLPLDHDIPLDSTPSACGLADGLRDTLQQKKTKFEATVSTKRHLRDGNGIHDHSGGGQLNS